MITLAFSFLLIMLFQSFETGSENQFTLTINKYGRIKDSGTHRALWSLNGSVLQYSYKENGYMGRKSIDMSKEKNLSDSDIGIVSQTISDLLKQTPEINLNTDDRGSYVYEIKFTGTYQSVNYAINIKGGDEELVLEKAFEKVMILETLLETLIEK